jgi:V/A-type H+-transporting ATPase subunit I
MIVPMKKVSLAVFEGDCEASLKNLREAGVLHINKKSVSSENLVRLLDRQGKVGKAIAILSRYTVKENDYPSYFPTSDEDLVVHILGLVDEKKILQDQLVHNVREKQRIEAWGEFDMKDYLSLEKEGIVLTPYEFQRKVYDTLKVENQLIVVSKDKDKVRVFAVGDKIPGATPFVFPPVPLSHINERIEHINLRTKEIEDELESFAYRSQIIKDEASRLPIEIEFETARAGMEQWADVSVVSWLTGFAPADKIDVLKQAASDNGWAVTWEDPKPEDNPPTLTKNNKLVELISPLFSFLGTIPGYREMDISPSYFVFFSLFFAMILGDAAYGVVVMAIALAFGFGAKKKDGVFSPVAKLLLLLSSTTIIWGAINGSWFMIPRESLPAFMAALIIPPFNNTGPVEFPLILQNLFKLPAEVPMDEFKTRWSVQFLCFSVAVIQLTWARGKRIIRLLPSLTAVAQVGWLVLMIALYFLVLSMLLGLEFPAFASWLIGIGLGLIIIFTEQNGGNFLKNAVKGLSGLFSLFLKAVGCFADVISYIRLFAVGLAGSMIGSIFNQLAFPAEGFGNFGLAFVIKFVLAVVIVIFGHGLNLMLTALSIIVHGVRLNLLEYAGNHLEMEWTGYTYNPFALKQKNK